MKSDDEDPSDADFDALCNNDVLLSKEDEILHDDEANNENTLRNVETSETSKSSVNEGLEYEGKRLEIPDTNESTQMNDDDDAKVPKSISIMNESIGHEEKSDVTTNSQENVEVDGKICQESVLDTHEVVEDILSDVANHSSPKEESKCAFVNTETSAVLITEVDFEVIEGDEDNEDHDSIDSIEKSAQASISENKEIENVQYLTSSDLGQVDHDAKVDQERDLPDEGNADAKFYPDKLIVNERDLQDKDNYSVDKLDEVIVSEGNFQDASLLPPSEHNKENLKSEKECEMKETSDVKAENKIHSQGLLEEDSKNDSKLDSQNEDEGEPILESQSELSISEENDKKESQSRRRESIATQSYEHHVPEKDATLKDISDKKGEITTSELVQIGSVNFETVTTTESSFDVIDDTKEKKRTPNETNEDLVALEVSENSDYEKSKITSVKDNTKEKKKTNENLDQEVRDDGFDDFEVVTSECLEEKTTSSHETSTDVLYNEALSSVKYSEANQEKGENIEKEVKISESDNFVIIDPEGQNLSVEDIPEDTDDDVLASSLLDNVQTSVQVDADKEWSPADEEEYQNNTSKSEVKIPVEMVVETKMEEPEDSGLKPEIDTKAEELEYSGMRSETETKTDHEVITDKNLKEKEASKIDDAIEDANKSSDKEPEEDKPQRLENMNESTMTQTEMKDDDDDSNKGMSDMNEFTEIHHEEKSDVVCNEEVVEEKICQESLLETIKGFEEGTMTETIEESEDLSSSSILVCDEKIVQTKETGDKGHDEVKSGLSDNIDLSEAPNDNERIMAERNDNEGDDVNVLSDSKISNDTEDENADAQMSGKGVENESKPLDTSDNSVTSQENANASQQSLNVSDRNLSDFILKDLDDLVDTIKSEDKGDEQDYASTQIESNDLVQSTNQEKLQNENVVKEEEDVVDEADSSDGVLDLEVNKSNTKNEGQETELVLEDFDDIVEDVQRSNDVNQENVEQTPVQDTADECQEEVNVIDTESDDFKGSKDFETVDEPDNLATSQDNANASQQSLNVSDRNLSDFILKDLDDLVDTIKSEDKGDEQDYASTQIESNDAMQITDQEKLQDENVVKQEEDVVDGANMSVTKNKGQETELILEDLDDIFEDIKDDNISKEGEDNEKEVAKSETGFQTSSNEGTAVTTSKCQLDISETEETSEDNMKEETKESESISSQTSIVTMIEDVIEIDVDDVKQEYNVSKAIEKVSSKKASTHNTITLKDNIIDSSTLSDAALTSMPSTSSSSKPQNNGKSKNNSTSIMSMKREVSYETFTKASSQEKRLKISSGSEDEEDLENVKWLITMREEISQTWTKHISQSSSESEHQIRCLLENIERHLLKIDKLKGMYL